MNPIEKENEIINKYVDILYGQTDRTLIKEIISLIMAQTMSYTLKEYVQGYDERLDS